MDQIKVSVIMPVYNGGSYLRQCLDSVRAQTLKDIEIICVDDLSTDSSWTILKEYRAADDRFQLIRHQENQGVSAARNDGLTVARGEHIIFWDCDDFFEPNALELLYQRAQETNADICVCGADRYFQDKGKCYPIPSYLDAKLVPKDSETFNRITNPKHILNFTTVCLWNKLFRRAFLEERHLTMPPFRFGEDCYFSITALCLADRIAIVKDTLVHYRFNNSSSLVGQVGKESKLFLPPRMAVADHLRALGVIPEDSFGWSSIGNVIYALRLSETREAFLETARLLHEDGVLEKLCIVEREPEYYKSARQERYAQHLIHDEPEDLLAFLMHDTYLELREVTANRNELREDRDKLKMQVAKSEETYESTLAQLSEEKNLLETRMQALSEKNQQLQQEQKSLIEHSVRQTAALEILTDEKRQLQQEQKALTENNARQAAALEILTEEKRQLQQEQKALTDSNARQAAALEILAEEKRQLQQEQKALTESNARQAAALEILTDEKRQYETELETLTENNLRLTLKMETLSAQLSKAKAQTKAKEKELQALINSRAFRLGKAILYLPRKIRSFFRKK